MTPVEKFNAVRRDVIDLLILAMCCVAFYVSYQNSNTPAQSNTCINYDQETFASHKQSNIPETTAAQINDLSHLDFTSVGMHHHEYLPKSAANHSDS